VTKTKTKTFCWALSAYLVADSQNKWNDCVLLHL